MKKTSLFILSLCCMAQLSAQNNAEKLTLKKGQKFYMHGNDSSGIAQKMGEQPMNMTTLSTSVTEYEVLEEIKGGFLLKSTLTKIKIDFDGFGQKMVYDSEDPKKQEGMMAEQLKNSVGKSDTLQLSIDGTLVEDDSKEKDRKKGRGRGGMMRMMDMQSASVENAFLLVPKDATVGQGWKADKTKEGVKTQTIYFVDAIDGNIAKVSFKRKKKGTRVMKNPQGEMNMDVDNLSSGIITVNLTSGMVLTYAEDTDSKTIMKSLERDMSSTGKTVSKLEVK